MKLRILLFLSLIFIVVPARSQHFVSGTFHALSDQRVQLVGFDGFETYTISSASASASGRFSLTYSEKDCGMAYLESQDNSAFIVILAPDDNLHLEGESLANTKTISIKSGRQNQLFEQYASEHPRRDQALSAWDYLVKIYRQDSLFSAHQKPQKAIETEIQRIKQEDDAFLASLDSGSYISWFLPVRKLVSSVPTIAQYRTDEIPAAIHSFRTMDYTDPRLWKSGLLRDVIDAHFWLIENSGRPLDSVFVEMNKSIDLMIENIAADEEKFNAITDYLFNLLERRSLFTSAEYLALKVLNEVACTVSSDLAEQLESYRAMKLGNIASDISFNPEYILNPAGIAAIPKSLSGLKSNYTVVVFGASWCPGCTKDIPQIATHYSKWKSQGVEVVFVSLDTDQQQFNDFASGFPFISICDYQGWESPIAKSYHVFATPTIYLLDNKREILLKPRSVQQMDAWVDWYLVKGNK